MQHETTLHCRDPVINRIPFHGFEASAVDHFDDLLFGQFHFAFGSVGVGLLAAVNDCVPPRASSGTHVRLSGHRLA